MRKLQLNGWVAAMKMNMKKNVGNLDSVIRVFLGVIIIITGLMIENWWGLLGLVLIITGGLSWCPIYRILGIETSYPGQELEV